MSKIQEITNTSVKKNFLINSVYQFLVMCIPLITTPYLSRTLGASGIGEFSLSQTIANYFVILSLLGISNYGNRAVAQARADELLLRNVFSEIYSIQIVMSGISLALYLFVTCFVDSDVKTLNLIMVGYVLSAAFDVSWVYFGLEDFKYTVLRSSIIKILIVVFTFIFVKTPEDVRKYALIFSVGTLLSQVLLWIMLPKRVLFIWPNRKDVLKHLKSIIILFVPVIAISLYKYMDKIMLGFMSSKLELGFYESSERIIQVPIALVTSLGVVMLPRISLLVSKGDDKITNNYFWKSIHLALFLSTSIGFGIMGVCKEFIPLFYGSGYDKCVYLYMVLLPSCIFVALANVFRTQYLIPLKMDNQYVVAVLSGAGINLLMNSLLIPVFQSIGAAIGTLMAEVSVCLIQCYCVKKSIDLKRLFLLSGKYISAGILMFMVLFFISLSFSNILTIAIKVVIGALVYLLLIYFINGKELKSLFKD